jgi:hypothetical protein
MIKRGYWDIDDILADEEPIMVQVTKTIKGAGFLNPESEELDLNEHTRFTIPLWLAENMATRELAKIEVPKIFGESYLNILEADPRIISLKDRSNYFFEVATKLNDFIQDGKFIAPLQKVFVARFVHLYNEITHNSDPKIIKKLTELERDIYEKGMKTTREFFDWRERKFDIIRSAQHVMNNAKRFKLK